MSEVRVLSGVPRFKTASQNVPGFFGSSAFRAPDDAKRQSVQPNGVSFCYNWPMVEIVFESHATTYDNEKKKELAATPWQWQPGWTYRLTEIKL